MVTTLNRNILMAYIEQRFSIANLNSFDRVIQDLRIDNKI
ncbi:hypothetical protein K661_02823 [Piscirickettsia salmonis LF-89 = ATCC VR-1361]|nr:hypothetical protein K661_02823 [Piscirickettsia salmonis LF-89 = ATCC VR-1361]